MNSMPKEMFKVHDILQQYVSIHDQIFKLSLRKVIPIPRIFKPIDYGRHHRDLSHFATDLQNIDSSLQQSHLSASIFGDYVRALLETINLLRDMCRKLYQKSQGNLDAYTSEEYNQDMATYRQSVENYRHLGTEMNKAIR